MAKTAASNNKRNENGLYDFERLPLEPKAVSRKQNELFEKLHIFETNRNNMADVASETVLLARPVTPINDEIKEPPHSVKKLTNLARRRITSKELSYITVDDQQSLAAILVNELGGIWHQIRYQVDDPFLTKDENKELQRRIAVHLITVTEQLFLHYIKKAQKMNSRGVFSSVANLSRLKAQLSLDCGKYYNILAIRRYIVSDIKTGRNQLTNTENQAKLISTRPANETLSVSALLLASRRNNNIKNEPRTTTEHLSDLSEKITDLDMSKLDLVVDSLQHLQSSVLSDYSILEKSGLVQSEENVSPKPSPAFDSLSKHLIKRITLKKCPSAPNLLSALADSLAMELDLEKTIKTSESIYDLRSKPFSDLVKSEEFLKSRSKRLHDINVDGDPDDVAPLVQAQINTNEHDIRMDELNTKLLELEEMEMERVEQEKLYVRKPTFPQPETAMMSDKNSRRAVARISERICMSTTILKSYDPVFNELLGEIDEANMKALDSNLYLTDEVSEVYGEIMKTVSKDHLSMEEDKAISPCAPILPLSIHRKKVINKSLKKVDGPPWKNSQRFNKWQHTPTVPPMDSKGRQLLIPTIPKGSGLSDKEFLIDKVTEEEQENAINDNDIMARAYSSWLAWWKQTINSEDYLKYLSTQETDYMRTVFHLYDSEEEEDDELIEIRKKEQEVEKRKLEKKEKRKEWLKDKDKFEKGFWNVQAVTLGGLGALKPENIIGNDSITDLTINVPKKSDVKGNTTQVFSRKVQRSAIENAIKESKLAEIRKEEKRQRLQKRLDAIWAKLHIPEAARLDMAIKYSTRDQFENFERAINIWEMAADLVVEREKIVTELETFEKTASDPNRFFERGIRGNSVSRLKEGNMRTGYYNKLEEYEFRLEPLLKDLKENYNDVVSWYGRPYADKMKWDKTEMLHWLQEERKSRALSAELK